MSIPDPLPESVDDIGNPNSQAKRRQGLRWLLVIGTAATLGGLVFYMVNFSGDPKGSPAQSKAMEQRTLATAGVAGPAAISPEAENTRLRGQMSDLQQQLEAERQERASLATQNAMLSQPTASPRPIYAPDETRATYRTDQTGREGAAQGGRAPTSQPPGTRAPIFADAAAAGEPQRRRTIKLSSATPANPAASSDASAADKIAMFDSSDIVAPNSYVEARVLVGVDVQTGVTAAADPKPVLFRIDGRAVGVGSGGRYQTSDLRGCLVNGAAYAELSSEKVFVKLQKITCPLEGGKYLVSKVDGYVSYQGKVGVRGRVVSREGGFANRALIAGTLQGLGQAMSLNNQRTLTSMGGNGVTTSPLSSSEIAEAAAGGGIGGASSMLADYYIKRAEQYQPVIEMPTGMAVELVFLDGFRFTGKETVQ